MVWQVSVRIVLLQFLVLSVEKDFIVFQKRLFSVKSLTLRLLK